MVVSDNLFVHVLKVTTMDVMKPVRNWTRSYTGLY